MKLKLGLSFLIGISLLISNAIVNLIRAEASPVVYTVSVNGQYNEVQAYKIKNEIYFNWRDIAFILNGTLVQFQVESDGEIYNIISDKAYSGHGTELRILENQNITAYKNGNVYIDGNLATNIYEIEGEIYQNLDIIADEIGMGRLTTRVEHNTTFAYIYGVSKQDDILEDEFTLTLKSNQPEVWLNGELHYLPLSPFIENETFFIPIHAIIELLGGKYSTGNDVITTEIWNLKSEFSVDSNVITVFKNESKSTEKRYAVQKDPNHINPDKIVTPVMIDGIVFVPIEFAEHIFYESGFFNKYNHFDTFYPEAEMVIMGGFRNESGVNEVKLNYYFDYIQEDLKSKLMPVGVVDEVIGYNIEKYRNETLEIYVMRSQDKYQDQEHMDGKVCAIKVLGESFQTPRGLSVGNSKEKTILLYGNTQQNINLYHHFFVELLNEKVKSISFSSRYYTPN